MNGGKSRNPPERPRRHGALLVGILLLALALRWAGIGWGLPDRTWPGEPPIHPDEAAVYQRGATLYSAPDAVTFTWGGSLYYRVSYLAGRAVTALGTESASSHFAATVLLLRGCNVLLGVATVAIVAMFGMRAFGATVGLAAGALLACFPNHVLASHYARPDILTTFWISASLACAGSLAGSGQPTERSRSGERRHNWLFVGASVLAGLAIATSYWGLAALPALGVAWLVRRRTLGWIALVGLLALVAAGYLLGSFETFVYWDAFRDAVSRATAMHDTGEFRFPVALLTTVSFYAFGTIATLCAWAGFASMLARRHPVDAVLAIFLLAGGLLLSRMDSEMIRYLLFLSPAIAIAAALGALAFGRAIAVVGVSKPVGEGVAAIAVVLFTLQLSATYVLEMVHGIGPRERIGRELADRARPGAIVGVTQSFYGDHTYAPRFPPDHQLRLVPLLLREDSDASGYLQRPLDYVATSDFARGHARSASAREFFRALDDSGRFRPVLAASPHTPPLRLADWLGARPPGDLLYLQSGFAIYESVR